MKEFMITVKDPSGIHARPAGLLVKEASKYESSIIITHNGKSVDGKRIFAIMSLSAKYGDTLKIAINGSDEESAAENLKDYFEKNL